MAHEIKIPSVGESITSATLGTGSLFSGNILADQSITLNTSVDILCGRAIALNAAVTIDTNTISNNCFGNGSLGSERSDYGSLGFSGQAIPVAAVPEPSAASTSAWVEVPMAIAALADSMDMAGLRNADARAC